MTEYWESRFKDEGALWGFEPADSALIALRIFKSLGINDILIPGFGYGRNAKLFYENGIHVTGIELSASAIKTARQNGIDCTIHHGSVASMPYDDHRYGGIFCYAMIHLLNYTERHHFLNACDNQLITGGCMIFVVTSKESENYGKGRHLSKDRYEISKGLKVFFYDACSIVREFAPYGLETFYAVDEPVKFMPGFDPIKLIFIKCMKTSLIR